MNNRTTKPPTPAAASTGKPTPAEIAAGVLRPSALAANTICRLLQSKHMPLDTGELSLALAEQCRIASNGEFSNSQNANIQKWSAYIKGSANRQDFLGRALDWASKGTSALT